MTERRIREWRREEKVKRETESEREGEGGGRQN